VLPYGLFGVGLYEGYFGAAAGVMTLTLLMLTVQTRLVRANAFKNAVLGAADAVAAICFAIFRAGGLVVLPAARLTHFPVNLLSIALRPPRSGNWPPGLSLSITCGNNVDSCALTSSWDTPASFATWAIVSVPSAFSS
jgi:hypothetical protein